MPRFLGRCRVFGYIARASALISLASLAAASASTGVDPSLNVGPYNVAVLEGGIGMERALAPDAPLLAAGSPWSISGWVRSTRLQSGAVILVAIGDAEIADGAWRGVLLLNGELALALNPSITLRSGTHLEPGRWYAIAATYDGGTARLYVDGRECAGASAATLPVAPHIELAPVSAMSGSGTAAHFGGRLAQLTLASEALGAQTVHALALERPDFSLVTFNAIGVGWPLQEHAWRGLQEPQDPWTLPHGKSPPSAPVATPVPVTSGGLKPERPGLWTLDAWHLRAAPEVEADGAQLSRSDYPERQWYAAVVPGTVLTTLIARGVYPDPDYGLNNLTIPDTLSRQDYWFRSVFSAPAELRDRELTLTFKGINYAAEVWLNGQRLGCITGAFTRGIFDVSGVLKPGLRNAIAVRIAPPPHPGIPHEQSMAAGPGENGGALALDGPTFIATEGWDWIPGIRDRNAGLWQEVELAATGGLRLLDPHVMTRLPLPRTDSAEVAIAVAIDNRRAAPVHGTLIARFDAITVRKAVDPPRGVTIVSLDPQEFPQLHLVDPQLWWPNGYGQANLHTLELELDEGDSPSDTATVRFGIRELTYELSLFDHDGQLRRVEVDPTLGTLLGQRLVDVRHEAIKRTTQGWAASLTAAGETSLAVHPVASESLTPFLVIRVNGVPIAARGGSWGMDDSRKRISRAHLEPFFKLHRDANLNVIRNWLGQNTEEVFYDLADEYGLLVLNDFWASTQDFQLEPQDPALFLANARDVISRYRNHPSIAVWFGRNEGVPQPILNEGLAELVATLDGTRYYTGSSNSVNLQGSGPYNYRPPEQYFSGLARGFSVEVGTPSLSTLESLRASIPAADRWPLSDTYAYHDWHFGGNGDVATFMAAMALQYGAPSSLEDFERKAQLMNYVSYRAIFEGFQAHLWTENSGRLLWMTHPSWPSNTWQIYSSDYDTAAAYYAVKKACEPVHAQLNLPDYGLAVVNTTRGDRPDLTLRTRVLSLDDRVLAERVDHIDAAANSVVMLPKPLDLSLALAQEGLVLVKLTLSDSSGGTVSDNVYWPAREAGSQQRLNELPAQPVTMTAESRPGSVDGLIDVVLANRGNAPVLTAKITMLDARGGRVLPVYYSDNYVALLAGEVRHIEVRCPAAGPRCARVALRGWNVENRETPIKVSPMQSTRTL
jgi:beta-galactosidase/beta-glucuronidase